MKIYSLRSTDDDTPYITASLQRSLKPHNVPVVTTAIDNTGTLIATGAADGTIKVWDIRGGYLTHTFHGHSGVISALKFFQAKRSEAEIDAKGKKLKQSKVDSNKNGVVDGEQNAATLMRLASGGEDGMVRIWRLDKRKSLAILDSHVSVVRGLDYSPKSNCLLSVSRDKTAILWHASDWRTHRIIPVLESAETAGFHAEGRSFYVGGERGRIRLFDTQSFSESTEEQSAQGEADAIVHSILDENHQHIISVHANQTLIFHSTASNLDLPHQNKRSPPLPIIRRISGSHDEVIDIAFMTPEKSLLALATNSEDIRLVSLDRSAEEQSSSGVSEYFGGDVASLQGHTEIIICIAVDSSGCWLATGAKDNTARLWYIDQHTNTYKHYATFTGHAESIGAIALSQNRLSGDPGPRKMNSDGVPALLLTGSNDRTIKQWTIPKAPSSASKTTYTRKAHDKDINALAISPSLQMFASASQDRTVKIWSMDEGETQGVLRGHKRGVWSVAFAPKGTPPITDDSGAAASSSRGLLLTGSGDRTVKVWSLNDYACIRTLEGHTNNVLKVLWLPPSGVVADANPASREQSQQPTIASAGADGLVKVWSPFSGECLTTLDNHTDRIWALAYDQASRTLVSGGGDSVITFWKDTSLHSAVERDKAAVERIEQDQELRNCEREGKWREGIVLALQLNHPARLLGICQSVVDTSPAEEGSISGINAVDDVIAELADEQLLTLLMRLRDWNTSARTARVAQRFLNVIVRCYTPDRLKKLGRRRGGRAVLEALAAYTERHYRRNEEIWGQSFIVDFFLGQMDQLGAEDNVADSAGGVESQKDVIMI